MSNAVNGNTGPENRNKNLKNLNINGKTTNKKTFVTAFKSAATVAGGVRFPEIAEKCSVIANTLDADADANNKINLGSKFGNYNNGVTINVSKVTEFMGGSTNAPTRGAILIKILSEIKDLVKNRRNSNKRLTNNIETAKNFNMAIINLINAVNKAKKGNNTPANATNAAKQAFNAAKKAYANAKNKSAAVKAYANAINAYASGVNVNKAELKTAQALYYEAPTNQSLINKYAAAINAYANAVKAKKNQGNVPAAQ